jgi:hypothetical protein
VISAPNRGNQTRAFQARTFAPGKCERTVQQLWHTGCHYKDSKNPQKHGSYYQLSYGWRDRSSTLFVRRDQVGAMPERVANYKHIHRLVREWVDLAMGVERQERAARPKHGNRSK